ncbi:hypothetical protein F443_21199 [Phytophthora nicotianae P1569]|uniref:Uncharacterized protein n=1 Tax=Phytophthora nicotianae P1569 TaxID=1317065 RepID=V9DYF1_PHYNI|nr:hypothetical protein F443_21199 [Phytophthora nicotianae P1569]
MPPPALRVNTAHHKRLGGQYTAFSNAFGEPAAFERPLPSSLPSTAFVFVPKSAESVHSAYFHS